MAIDNGDQSIVRFFTSARRIPILIGKFPQGGRIWGGPYRISQLVAGTVVLVVGWISRGIWGPLVGSPLVMVLSLLVVAGVTTWGAGRLPSTRRRLTALAMGAVTATAASSVGTYRGSAVRLPAPHRATGRVAMQLEPLVDEALPQVKPAAAAAAVQAPAPAPRAAQLPANVIPINRRSYATGLDRLLEQARGEDAS